MHKILFRFITVLVALGSLAANAASELQNYVQQCETELQFSASDVPALNCNNGFLFAGGSPAGGLVNDYFVYSRVNDTVDLVAACRWLDNHSGPSTIAGSVELLIHNRQNGSTCFFSAKGTTAQTIQVVSVAIVSPTNFSTTQHPNADDYWSQPTDLNNLRLPSDQNAGIQPGFPSASSFTDPVQCVGCHSQGPYIASQDIVPFLTQFGLLNNGHPTLIDMTAPQHYHAVGSSGYNKPVITAFQNWDSIIANNNIQNGCSAGCHSLAANSTIGTLFTIPGGIDRLLPSIHSDIVNLVSSGVMPPSDDYSDYRWINLDTPGDGVESESFAAAKSASTTLVPTLLSQCAAPVTMEAHVVGSTNTFMVAQASNFGLLPDRLSVFNLKDGLVCLNSDQEPGQTCQDYSTSYECTDANGKKTWTGWYNTDSPSTDSSGDNEKRSRDGRLCPSGSTATGIQAETTLNINGWTYGSIGPNDRLAQISPYGLTCNNADQPDGQCSNYVVRYEDCTTAPQVYSAKLSSAYSGKLLTASSSSNNALTKGEAPISGSTQGWSVEPVLNTEYVRLRNIGTNTYLNETSQAESATVVTSTSSTSTSEEWIVEPSTYGVRLKNLWSGKYLTMATTGTISAIYSQSRNTSLANQRWGI